MAIRKIDGSIIDADITGGHALINMKLGTYTGDNADNKAIAHGLGEVPKLVLIWAEDLLNAGMVAGTKIITLTVAAASADVTDWNDTSFYVEDSNTTLNHSAYAYSFLAIGS